MIVFFPHTATNNHGCEAILVSIAKLFEGKGFKKDNLALIHRDTAHDDYTSLTKYYNIFSYPKTELKRGSFRWLWHQFNIWRYGSKEINYYLEFKSYMSKKREVDAFISIGGDNYCYGTPYFMYAVDRYANESHARLILWGCSVEENCDEKKLQDLERFDLIIARESLTFHYLKSKLNNKILCLPDPAFTLEKQEDPAFILPKGTVGINISPMIMEYEMNSGKVYNNYRELISYILKETSFNIAFIPHVTAVATDDRVTLNSLFNEFRSYKDRLYVVSEGNCCQLKFAISQCQFFIGARTHATIAAYSSEVPTIVVGYSIKSRGIAVDLFGQERHFVIPVQSLNDDNILVTEFKWLQSNENKVKETLHTVIPKYCQRARMASDEVMKEILKYREQKKQ